MKQLTHPTVNPLSLIMPPSSTASCDESKDYLSAKEVLTIRAKCATMRNFATCVMRKISDEDVRKVSNVNGVKKQKLDTDSDI